MYEMGYLRIADVYQKVGILTFLMGGTGFVYC